MISLRMLIREQIAFLSESKIKDSDLIPHTEVVAAIDKQIGPNRIDIKSLVADSSNGLPASFYENFRKCLIEFAVKESGYSYSDQKTLGHVNPKSGTYKGVFQIGDSAIEDTQRLSTRKGRTYMVGNQAKTNWDKSNAAVNPWHEQKTTDVFDNVNMQAVAAAFFVFQKFYDKGKPAIDTVASRASFWKSCYNTEEDTSDSATVQNYKDKMAKYGFK